jgi:hypothetical protein
MFSHATDSKYTGVDKYATLALNAATHIAQLVCIGVLASDEGDQHSSFTASSITRYEKCLDGASSRHLQCQQVFQHKASIRILGYLLAHTSYVQKCSVFEILTVIFVFLRRGVADQTAILSTSSSTPD